MKKRTILILGLALILGINGCGNSDKTADSNIEQEKEDAESKAEELTGLTELNPFDGLQVSFEGFSGNGKIKIDTSNCNKIVREYVQFEYDTALDGKLSNEYNIVISAVSKHENLTITESEHTYTVSGLYMFDEEYGNYLDEFSDGMARFRYINPNDNKTYIAYMDNAGSVKFQFDASEINYGSAFENGNAMIKFNNENAVAIVDKSGEVVKTIDITKNTIAEANGIENAVSDILFFEEGFCIVKTDVEDFSNKYYLYTFYDSNGECVFVDKMAPEDATDYGYYLGWYRGDNVIYLQGDSDYMMAYFLEGNCNALLNRKRDWFQFNDGYGIYDIETFNANTISLISSNGDIIEKQVSAVNLSNYDISSNHNNGNIMMLRKDEMEYGYYNIESNTFISSSEYASQIEGIPVFCGEAITAKMRGADGESYIGIFDMNWNLVTNPIKGKTSGAFPNGVWISNGDTYNGVTINNYNCRYYDYSGNLLFETGDELLEFSEGLAYNGNCQWVNANNEVVIDGLDFSSVKTVQLSVMESVENAYSIEGTYTSGFGNIFQIESDGTLAYVDNSGTYNLTYSLTGDSVWTTSPVFGTELTLYIDDSGNLFADGDEQYWIDEYFRRQ